MASHYDKGSSLNRSLGPGRRTSLVFLVGLFLLK